MVLPKLLLKREPVSERMPAAATCYRTRLFFSPKCWRNPDRSQRSSRTGSSSRDEAADPGQQPESGTTRIRTARPVLPRSGGFSGPPPRGSQLSPVRGRALAANGTGYRSRALGGAGRAGPGAAPALREPPCRYGPEPGKGERGARRGPGGAALPGRLPAAAEGRLGGGKVGLGRVFFFFFFF